MTEAEWLASSNSEPMLAFLSRSHLGERKLRLLACAWAREWWRYLREPGKDAVETAERFADGRAGRPELVAACKSVCQARQVIQNELAGHRRGDRTFRFVWLAREAIEAASYATDLAWSIRACLTAAHRTGEVSSLGDSYTRGMLVHDIFGNPFHSVAVDAEWLARSSGTAIDLAASIYETREFDRVPQLADALEKAGCPDDDLLSHLRGPGPHVLGCWALDLLLEKS
jgi:hypothetical protein